MSERANEQLNSGPVGTRLRRRDALMLGAGAMTLSAMMPGVALAATRHRPTLAEIANGKLRGDAAGGILSFKGIPYGAPTGGANRFLAPQPPAQWAGVRDATRLGDQSPQAH